MLEIFAIIKLTKVLAGKAEAKGRSTGWGALLPLFWIGGEILGFILGALLLADADMGAGAYIIALIGAATGAASAFLVVSMLGDNRMDIDHGYAAVPGAPLDPSNPYSPPGASY